MAEARSRSRAEARFGGECRPNPHLKMGANKSLLKQAESPVSFNGFRWVEHGETIASAMADSQPRM